MEVNIVRTAALSGLMVALTACGGGSSSSTANSSSSGYAVTVLVSDIAGITAAHHDSSLVNPWGMAFEPTGAVWIANNGTQTSTLYDGTGAPQSLVVNLPAGANGSANPTGLVYNGSSDFVVSNGVNSAAVSFIYDGEGGTISGWSGSTGNTTIVKYDDGVGKAVYKGLAIAASGGSNYLYAADFYNAKVDVFDHNFTRIASAGGFNDPTLPTGYAPFGIQNIQGNIVVTYALQAAGKLDEVDGAGMGYVDLYTAGGALIKRLVSAGELNAPWGVALAPASFGAFSNALLVGNFGDGHINAYNASTGAYLGKLSTPAGAAITIPGLWAIGFGNGYASQPTNTLFFTAGSNNEADGSYGRIDTQTMGSTSSGGGY